MLTAFISINKMERFTRGPLLRALSGGRGESDTLTTTNEFISPGGRVTHTVASLYLETRGNLDAALHSFSWSGLSITLISAVHP